MLRRSIAIVDDEPAVRIALQHLLRSAGFEVTCFETGAEFLAALGSRAADCVLLDLHLPGIPGLEVLERMSRLASPAPAIVITGNGGPGVREQVLAAGAAEFLTKPLEEEVLLEAIERVIAGARPAPGTTVEVLPP